MHTVNTTARHAVCPVIEFEPKGRAATRPNRVTLGRTISQDNQALSLDGFIVFECRTNQRCPSVLHRFSRGGGGVGTQGDNAAAGLCSRSSLSNYPEHRGRSATGTSGDNTPGSPDFPVPLDPLPLDLEYFALGVLNVVKTSRQPPS